MTLTELRATLEALELKPLKRFGQNFLVDANMVRAIVAAAVEGYPSNEPVTEIGPGLGALTHELVARGHPTCSIEVDRGLAAHLRERLAHAAHFRLIECDALLVAPEEVGATRLLVGNLPYYISTPLVARWMAWQPEPPERMVFTLQREVCERLAAKAGTKDYGALTVAVQADYEVKLLRYLPPEVFYPRPDVASAVVQLQRRASPPFASLAEAAQFHDWVRLGFSQRRKQVGKLLGIADERRAEQITVMEWIELWKAQRARV